MENEVTMKYAVTLAPAGKYKRKRRMVLRADAFYQTAEGFLRLHANNGQETIAVFAPGEWVSCIRIGVVEK